MEDEEKAASPKEQKEETKPEAMEVGTVQPSSDSDDDDDDMMSTSYSSLLKGEDDDDEEEEKDEAESTAAVESAASSSSSSKPSLNLAGFLFGNIDGEGKLSDDHSFLDSDTRAKLGGLSALLGSSGSEILKDEDNEGTETVAGKGETETEEFDATEKAPEAVDFSGIEEALSEEDSDSSDSSSDDDGGDEKKGENLKEDEAKESKDDKDDKDDKDAKDAKDDKETENSKPAAEEKKDDGKLMPPPSVIPAKPKAETESTSPSKPEYKPLAGMLPEKYKDVDVKELFPEFRHNKVLRFSRLFGIKSSNRFRRWKGMKKQRSAKAEVATTSGGEVDEAAAAVRELERAMERHTNIGSDGEWKFDYAPYPDDPNAYAEDQAVRFHQWASEQKKSQSEEEAADKKEEKKGPRPTDWRWGPAQYWYDMLNLPEVTEEYDYGLKYALRHLNDDVVVKSENGSPKHRAPSPKNNKGESEISFPDDAFLMVTQANWEDDIIWNGEDIKHKVLQKLNSKTNAAGWVPTGFNRTAGSFSGAGVPGQSGSKGGVPEVKYQAMSKAAKAKAIAAAAAAAKDQGQGDSDDIFYSIFPVENEELAYGRWEDEIIWDTENMPKCKALRPKMVSLDPNDDNIFIGMPDDIDPSTLPPDQPLRKVKVIQKHVKKSRMMLNRAGIISVVQDEAPAPKPTHDDRDPFNISNDEFYEAKAQEALIKVATGGTLLQHATPTVELGAPFVPTHMGPIKLRQFHRWPLKRFSHGPLSNIMLGHGLMSLSKHMKKKARAREAEREAAGGGDIFFMRIPEDVSGKDGEVVLFEYMEEHPPLLSLTGMASKVKNYYKRKPGSKEDPKGLKSTYGSLALAHTSPFLGQMAPGQVIQTIENNLYRSPVYEHKVPPSDFVVIRTRYDYSVREADSLFCAGQECPLSEVPGPNSKKANNFTRDFLQVFIYRLFYKSRDNPKRIKMDEIKKAFPAHSESSIRKRLKPCAEFHRTGHDSNWWVIKPGFRLPTEEEMRSMVTPEECCKYFSMIAAEQRLKDAGYGEKFLLAQADEDDDEQALKMDDEVKVAPWNTTRAYWLAMKGKCLLQLTGPADPTGQAGEGFSYVRIPNKPVNKEEVEAKPKRTVTGTDADLRKLPLKDARQILRKNGVPEKEIMKLSRWEVIDVVRTLSTEKVKAGEDGDYKFSRGNRFSIAEHQERYKEDCQRIFEVQNKVLASEEVLSSDDAESSDEEEDINEEFLDEMGKNLENMLANKKTSSQFLREREEMERRKLQKMIWDGDGPPSAKKKKGEAGGEESDLTGSDMKPKVLRITRTFRNASGKEYTRTELVRKSLVVETYVKVRETKDEAFIRQFATLDEATKEEMKKEKRRIQEQLRRIKRNQEKVNQLNAKAEAQAALLAREENLSTKERRKMAKLNKSNLRLVCGACGGKGHMKTNKACPKFVGDPVLEGLQQGQNPINVAMTEQDEEDMMEKDLLEIEKEGEELVVVDGTKMKVSGQVLKTAEEMRKRTMVLKVPKNVTSRSNSAGSGGSAGSKRRRAGTVEHCDYLSNKNYRPVKRRREDPLISLASFLEGVHAELRVMDEALQFLQPVNFKKVPDYLDKVKTPMDLQTIRERIQRKGYTGREDFLADVALIEANSKLYNGPADMLTLYASKLLEHVCLRFSENEETLMHLEKAINPLLDDNDQVALTYMFNKLLEEKIESLQESWPFAKPVDRKRVKNYYERIKTPMDLEQINERVKKHAYHNREEFLADMRLIYTNSCEFNGANNTISHDAKKILGVAEEFIEAYAQQFEEWEEKIRAVQAKAAIDAEEESIVSSEAASEQRPVKRGRPKKRSESSGKKALADDLDITDSDDDEDDEEWEPVQDEDESQNLQVTIEPLAEIQVQEEPVQMEVHYPAQEEVVLEEVDESYDPTADFFMAQEAPQPQQEQESVEVVSVPMDIPEGAIPQGEAIHIEMPQVEAAAAAAAEGGSAAGGEGTAGAPGGGGMDIMAEAMGAALADDLDISDSDDEDGGGGSDQNIDDKTVVAPAAPPLVPEPPPPDEDGIWF